MIGVENALSPIGEICLNLRIIIDIGGAMTISLSAQWTHVNFCDSNTGEKVDGIWLHKAWAPLGKKAVSWRWYELEIMVDVSHVSKESMKQMILPPIQAPIICIPFFCTCTV